MSNASVTALRILSAIDVESFPMTASLRLVDDHNIALIISD